MDAAIVVTDDKTLVECMETVWQSIDSLCSDLTDDQWKTPTDCPGWSVQDQLSHMVGSEGSLLGRAKPDHTPEEFWYIRNEIGRNNEVLVDWRRPSSGRQVLDEFREVTRERLGRIKAMTTEDFDQATETPIGPGAERDYLAIRVFDAWVHEQDMRRALGKPGGLDGPVARHSIERMIMAMPYVVARKSQAPDGATVVFQVTGPAGCTLGVGVEGGRGKEISPPDDPSVVLTMDVQAFGCLGCGRWTADQAKAAKGVQISGDQGLGQTILSQMNFMI